MLASAYTAIIIGLSEGPPEWNLWKPPEMRIPSWQTKELMSQMKFKEPQSVWTYENLSYEPMKTFLKIQQHLVHLKSVMMGPDY